RGPHQPGHSEGALRHRGRRGEARQEHLWQARAGPGRGRPPPRAGGAGLPARL
ncbi:MAG: Two-component transcriptional response regulator, LuxR family, partial [uncultured Rubrobacteraceae bacterium]